MRGAHLAALRLVRECLDLPVASSTPRKRFLRENSSAPDFPLLPDVLHSIPDPVLPPTRSSNFADMYPIMISTVTSSLIATTVALVAVRMYR